MAQLLGKQECGRKPGLSRIRTGEIGQAGLAHDAMSSGSLLGGIGVLGDAMWGRMWPRVEAADGSQEVAPVCFGPIFPKVGSVKL